MHYTIPMLDSGKYNNVIQNSEGTAHSLNNVVNTFNWMANEEVADIHNLKLRMHSFSSLCKAP